MKRTILNRVIKVCEKNNVAKVCFIPVSYKGSHNVYICSFVRIIFFCCVANFKDIKEIQGRKVKWKQKISFLL